MERIKPCKMKKKTLLPRIYHNHIHAQLTSDYWVPTSKLLSHLMLLLPTKGPCINLYYSLVIIHCIIISCTVDAHQPLIIDIVVFTLLARL